MSPREIWLALLAKLEFIWNHPAAVPWTDVLLVSLGAAVVGVFANRQKSRWNFCAQIESRSFHAAWVRRRNTPFEPMWSALPPTTDMRRLQQHVG